MKLLRILAKGLLLFFGFIPSAIGNIEISKDTTSDLQVNILEHGPLKEELANSTDHQLYLNRSIEDQTLYDFPALDQQLSEIVKRELINSLPPVFGDNLGSLLVGIAKGNFSVAAIKAKEIVCEAKNIGRYVNGLTGGDLVDLPVIITQQIGNIDVEIVFNSAKIYPQYAQIEVFVRLVIPQKEVIPSNAPIPCKDKHTHQDADAGKTVLYFGASDIYFSQDKGIIRGSIGLLSDYGIKLGDDPDPKVALWLTRMVKGKKIAGENTITDLDDEFEYSGTYINFDCNGFKEMGIGGRLFFSRDWVIPTNEFGHPLQAKPKDMGQTARLRADIQLVAQDWNDLLLSVNLSSPFSLASWNKMSFAIGKAHLDLSSFRNPPVMPLDDPEFTELGIAWEGIYIENLSITLPAPFKRATSSISESSGSSGPPPTERIRISAKHMLIDEGGVSANFSIAGEAPLIGGPIMGSEWGWSLDLIGITLENSNLTGFNFSGVLSAPIFAKEGGIPYSAYIEHINEENEGYHFDAQIPVNETIPVFNAAKVTFGSITLIVDVVNNEDFVTTARFSQITFEVGNPNDYANTAGGSLVKLPRVTILDLELSTASPRVRLLGGIEFPDAEEQEETEKTKVLNFPVVVSDPFFGTNPQNPDELNLTFGIMINLMKQNGNGVEATAWIKVIGNYVMDINGARHWEYDRLVVEGGHVTLSFPEVYGEGDLCIFEGDPIYERGFSAGLLVEIFGPELYKPEKHGKFELKMMAIFGSKEDYRYFLVDGFASGESVRVELYPGFYLDGFGGGVFHNMQPTSYNPMNTGGTPTSSTCASGASLSGIVFEPTKETKFGIKFSTSFAMEGGLMDGMLTCIIRFGQDMNLQNITFWGVADIMPSGLLQGIVEHALDDFVQELPKIIQSTEEIKNAAAQEATQVMSGIKARLGISFDFEGNFSFHGFAEATIRFVKENIVILEGSGSIDLLIDPDENDPRFHLYIGGYYPTGGPTDQITVPDFFSGADMVLLPVSVGINYGGFNVSANCYFLTGNDLPGPPTLPEPVVTFFELDAPQNQDIPRDNRHLLTCDPNDNAKGTGIAFGASAFFKFNKKKKGLIGCIIGYNVKVSGGLGFDISLLKYSPETQCSNITWPQQGMNGFRAGGMVYAFIDLNGQQVLCLPIPPLGVGLMVRFDVPNPSYFQVVAIIKIGKKFRVNLELGDECGRPCLSDVQFPD